MQSDKEIPRRDEERLDKEIAPRTAQVVTQLLAEARGGNAEALNQLIPLVYDELHALAEHKLKFERAGHTLNPTALVHEAYFRLVNQREVQWQSRTHFFAIAAQAMRRILVNYAAGRKTNKRGGDVHKVPLHEVLNEGTPVSLDEQSEAILALDDALTRLADFNPRGAQVVEYRFFGGLTHEEIAEGMGLSVITVRRAWTAAKTWIRRDLSGS